MFSARLSTYNGRMMLNICDADLLGRNLADGDLSLHINPACYGGKMLGHQEAEDALRSSHIINMVGENIVTLSTSMGIGARDGVRMISGSPFLIVLKM